MRQLRYALSFCLLCISQYTWGQIYFLNGSIEPVSTSTAVDCYDNPFYKINTIGWDYMTVTGPQTMYMATISCGLGAAEDSTHYIGLHYSPALHQGNQLLLQLSAPMTAGQSYRFSFYYKGPPPKTGSGTDLYTADLSFGYATTDSTTDSFVAVANLIPDTLWQLKVVTVRPSFGCSFVWVGATPQSGKTSDTAITYVDNFIFEPTSVEELKAPGKISLSPNPCHTITSLILDAQIALPAKFVIYDLAGRAIVEKVVKNRNTTISREYMQDGIYFLKVVDNNHNIYTTKLIAN